MPQPQEVLGVLAYFWRTHPNALHDRYNNAILHYMFFEQYCKGGKLKYCEVCGKLILATNNKAKYCKPCAKKVNIEKTNSKIDCKMENY